MLGGIPNRPDARTSEKCRHTMSFAVKYFRPAEVAEQFRAAGIAKPSGWVCGRDRYATQQEAQKLADHLNAHRRDEMIPAAIVTPIAGEHNSTRFYTSRWYEKQTETS